MQNIFDKIQKRSKQNIFLKSASKPESYAKQSFINSLSRLKNQNTSIQSNLGQAISQLDFRCCQQPMIKEENGKFKMSCDLYIMPCHHNVCENCLKQILSLETKTTISCSHRECTRNYDYFEVECDFKKNFLVESFLRKISDMYTKLCLSNRENIEKERISERAIRGNTFSVQKQKKNQQRENDIEVKQSKSSSGSSSKDQIFNECTNIFCKKPTLGLFCCEKCEAFQVQLENYLFPNNRFSNNQQNDQLILNQNRDIEI